MTSIDYLEMIREAPHRAVAAKTSRVRRGNLIEGPDSEIVAFEAGITDFARRWTLTHQELQGMPSPEEGHKVGRIERFVREISDVVTKPKDLLYIDGAQFLKDGDGRFVTSRNVCVEVASSTHSQATAALAEIEAAARDAAESAFGLLDCYLAASPMVPATEG